MLTLVSLDIPSGQQRDGVTGLLKIPIIPALTLRANFLKQALGGPPYTTQCNLSKKENRNMFPENPWC